MRVSDHALLRFMQRTGGFDVEGLRAAVEDSLARAIDMAYRLRAEEFRIVVDGLVYVVRDRVVTTVLDADLPRTKPSERRG